MSRGLGWLQRSVLRLTLDRGGLLLVSDLMRHLLGWPGKQGDGAKVFERSSIGEDSYNRGFVCMSRAIKGLRGRGLVQVYKNVSGVGTVVALTGAGRVEAEEIEWEGE